MEKIKYIKIYPEKCCGCRYCELVCSFWHNGKVNPKKSGIWIEKGDLTHDVPHVCSHGENCNFECISVCDPRAIVNENGVVKIYPEKCTGCARCRKACPNDAIQFIPKLAYKCDLCVDLGGKPICVDFCSQNAIEFVEDGKEAN